MTAELAIPIIPSVAPLAAGTEAWISDIWGVLHNGAAAFPSAGEACVRYRQKGGIVVLVTNAPYPETRVAGMLADLGVPREAYDAIVTSGDVTRHYIRDHAGGAILHLGPDRYLGIFEGVDVRRTEALDEARAVVATGLYHDERETPADYAERLAAFRKHNLDLICANPDIMVERGPKVVYCAGALAEAYEKLGGRVIYAGKPHAPIYEEAFRQLAALKGRAVPKERILAIGDGVRTDIAGAGAMRLDLSSSPAHFTCRMDARSTRRCSQSSSTAIRIRPSPPRPHSPGSDGLRWIGCGKRAVDEGWKPADQRERPRHVKDHVRCPKPVIAEPRRSTAQAAKKQARLTSIMLRMSRVRVAPTKMPSS